MNLFKTRILPFLILAIFALGCRSCDTVESNKVAQSTVYQDYEIFASKDSSSVSVTFRVGGSGGTTLDLKAPSRIEYNGKELTENLRPIFGGTTYSWSGSGFQNSHQFTYTNGDGRVFQNSASFDALELVPGVREVNPTEKVVLRLSRPLSENESIETSFSSLEPTPTPAPTVRNGNTRTEANTMGNGPSYRQSLHNNVSADKTAIEINAGDLKNFIPGRAAIRVVVQGTGMLQQKTETGGMITYTYTSQDIEVRVLK